MKKIINTFLIIGFVAFMAASCSPTVGKSTVPETPAQTPESPAPTTPSTPSTPTTPTTPPATTPTYVTVNSADGVFSVTAKPEGLLLTASFNAPWKHFTFVVRDITNSETGEWHESIDATPPVTQNGNSGSCSALFPFTAKDRKYKIYYTHMGNAENEWADWTECSGASNTVTITAAGGAGSLDVTCKSAQYWSPRRGLFLEDFDIVEPELANASKTLKVRAEKCFPENGWARWREERIFETTTIASTIWFPEEANNEFTNYIKGSDKLFFTVQYKIVYNNVEFSQRFYGNWADWDNENNCEISDSNWFIDYDCLDPDATKLPRIEINSIEDTDNEWVALPIAAHVKEQARAWTNEYDDYPDPYYKDCKISTFRDGGNTPELDDAAGQVKVRGNWTTSYAKKSLRIKFDNAQRMLGLHDDGAYKNWVLLAGYKDASLLRDAIGMKLYDAMYGDKYYVSDCQLVDLFINGVYWGVYLLAEQQEIQEPKIDEGTGNVTNPARINAKETPKGFVSTQTGYLIEFDSYSVYEKANEQFQIDYTLNNTAEALTDCEGRTLVNPQNGYTIKSDIRDNQQHDFIANYMNKVWEICYKAANNQEYLTFDSNYSELVEFTGYEEDDSVEEKCEKCISAIIDIKSLANMYIFNELICDPDLYLTSFFMDVDFGEAGNKLLRFEAPWDFDSTMGNKSFAIATTDGETIGGKQPQNMCTIGDIFAGACQTDVNCQDARIHANPWMVVFKKCGWFKDLVIERWFELGDLHVSTTIESYYNNILNNYGAHLEFNRARWGYPESDELCNASREAAQKSQQASAEYLKDWLFARWDAVSYFILGLGL